MAKKPYLLLTLFVALAAVCSAQYTIHTVRDFTVDGGGCNTNFPRLPFAENSFAMWGGAINDSGDLIENYVYDQGKWSSTGVGNGNLRVPTRETFFACVSDSILWGAIEDRVYYTTDYNTWNSIDISDSGRVNAIGGIYPIENGAVVISLNTFVVTEETWYGDVRGRRITDQRTRIIIVSKDTVIRLYDSPGNQSSLTICVPNDDNSTFISALNFKDTSAMLLVVDRDGGTEYVYPPYPMKYWFAPNMISRNSLGEIYVAYYHVGEERDVQDFVMRYNPITKQTSIIQNVSAQAPLNFSFYDGEFVYMPAGVGFYVFHGDRYVYHRLLELVPEIIYDNMPYGFTSINADTIVISIGGIKFAHIPKSILYSAVTSVDEEARAGRVAHGDRIDVPVNVADGVLVSWTTYNEVGQVLDNGSSTCYAGSVVVPLGRFDRTQIVNLVLSASGKPPITQRVFVE